MVVRKIFNIKIVANGTMLMVRGENTHKPIITYPQYIRVVSSLKPQEAKERKNL